MNIFGVGGHAKVVVEAVILSGNTIHNIYDDDITTHGSLFCGYKIIGSINQNIGGDSIIAIGNNNVRKKIDTAIKNCTWQTIIHPSAIISKDALIGEGTIVMAGAIIQPGVTIGRHCIINTGASIDHDCEIGDFVHIAPKCGLAGGIRVGEGTIIGIGTNIIQYLEIGSWATIGAGSTVINDIPGNCIAMGSPAKIKG